ncbi:MAG: hypothetical protein IJI21_06775 [Clostridia bacterium]|nr:hypothetical protein [Clostridia bacterium]
MNLIRRYVVPMLLIGLGIWIIADKQASLTIMGIVMVALSAVFMTLNVTNREMPKLVKIGYCVVDGAIGACGVFVLVAPTAANRFMQYLIGGISVIYAGAVLWELIRKKATTPFIILEAVALVLGLVLIFIQWSDSFFPIACGSTLAFTGLVTLLGRIFGGSGKKKIIPVRSTPVNVQENPAEASSVNAQESPANASSVNAQEIPANASSVNAQESPANDASVNAQGIPADHSHVNAQERPADHSPLILQVNPAEGSAENSPQ